MSRLLMAVAVALAIDNHPLMVAADPPPRPFRQKADEAFGWAPYLLVTYGVVPGLERFRCFDNPTDPTWPADLKDFPEELVKQLRAGDAEGRTAALDYLNRLAYAVRGAAWARGRGDGDRAFRRALGTYALPVQTSLEVALKGAKGEDRVNAAAVLLALAPDYRPAIDAVTAELGSSTADRRREACKAVGAMRLAQPEIITGLIARLTDREEKVRREAVVAIWWIGPGASGAVPALVELLKKDDPARHADVVPFGVIAPPKGQNVALLALAEMGPPAVPAVPVVAGMLEGADETARLAILTCLARLGPTARPALPALRLLLKSETVEDRLAAAAAILCIDPADAPAGVAITEGMNSEVKTTRRFAFGLFETMGPKAGVLVPVLTSALRDEDAGTRILAALALGHMGPLAEPALPALERMLADESRDSSTQMVAARALARIGRPAIPALERVFKEPEPTSRQVYVAAALGECRQDAGDAASLLEKALACLEKEVRLAAAASLGSLGQGAARSRKVLERVRQNDTSVEVRVVAAWALTQVEDVPAR